MIRKIAVIIMILILLLVPAVVNAANMMEIKSNGKSQKVIEVPIELNGNKIKMDAPGILIKDRTLVPVRFVAESIGATVNWINETKSVEIKDNSKTILMQIDSDVVMVNGEKKILDKNSIPKLISFNKTDKYPLADSRTMVPVRFISEMFGLDVSWNNDLYTVSIIKDKNIVDTAVNRIEIVEDGEYLSVIVGGLGKFNYKEFYIEQTNKIVVDIENSMLEIPTTKDTPGSLEVNSKVISKIEYSQFSYNPYVTRVVVSLKDSNDYKVSKSEENNQVLIIVDKEERTLDDKNDEEESNKNTEKTDSVANVNGDVALLSVKPRPEAEALMLDGLKGSDHTVTKLFNPSRLVYDFKYALINGEPYQEYDIAIGTANKVRIAQFNKSDTPNENVIRVVLDIEENCDFPNIELKEIDGALIIRESNSDWKNFNYKLNKDGLSIDVVIEKDNSKRHSFVYDESSRELSITMNGNTNMLPIGEYIIGNALIDKVIVVKNNDDEAITTIRFRKHVEIDMKSEKDDDYIEFTAVKKVISDSSDIRIVIDPGHGGKDPGAISIDGRMEKEFNITLSNKILRILEDLGYEVLMTRTTDEWVELAARPEFANQKNADVFLSIHANANLKSHINGLEVIYCPANECAIKSEDQYPFAKSIYDNIVALTGRDFGRGIVKDPRYVVINRTTMPALIIEAGYLTNVEDNDVLWQDEFQDKVAQGIVNGIIEYFGQ